jgi:hypothetical protein
MVRKQFIDAVKEKFGSRLICKPNKSLDSYYLGKVRRGNGVFWLDYNKSGNKGFRIHLQKVKGINGEIEGFGEYPVVFLSSQLQIPDILGKVERIVSYIDGRMTNRGDSVRLNSNTRKGERIRGTVTARKCKHCGHYEIGLITESGRYLPLDPGMKVEVVKK